MKLEDILKQVHAGELSIEAALAQANSTPATPDASGTDAAGFADLDFARLDTARAERRGFPETVFCPGKTDEQIVQILSRFRESESLVLASRATPEQFAVVRSALPDAKYFEAARLILVGKPREAQADAGILLVVSAGTSDIPVAEEAAVTAEIFGQRVERLYDVGVAGLHRLLRNLDRLREARAIITVAGMDGALPSVVGGLVAAPVIAVPTSTGYGAAFGGVSALLTMLNSCSPGVAVVNIDNGFGAAYMAATILRSRSPKV
ncbi:MAG: nickel pincer cofactor biosynthesis protein LarB [bacterium]|nr:nickel pincer cofactor biosynthesis protein LarB [bacterium]